MHRAGLRAHGSYTKTLEARVDGGPTAARTAEDRPPVADEVVHARVAEAWFRLGVILAKSNRLDLAVSAFEVLDRQFLNGTVPHIEEFVKQGLYHRAWSLNRAERFAEEEQVQIEYERRYGLPHRS